MELLGDLGLGFATALSPYNLLYCFIGVLLGTAVGVLPGLGPGRHHRHAAADHLRAAAGLVVDHAGRDLLRRAVRWIDYRDPDQPARRKFERGHGDRRLPDGETGSRRAGTRHRRTRLLLCRHGRHRPAGRGRPPAGGCGASVRAGGVLLADGAGAGSLGGLGQRLAAQSLHHDRARPAAGSGRQRRGNRHPALHLRHARDGRRAEFRGAQHGRLRTWRDPAQPGARAYPLRHGQARLRTDAVEG